jgi:hypothetical protein
MAENSFIRNNRRENGGKPVVAEVRVMHLRETAHYAGEAFGWHEDAARVPLDDDARRAAFRRVWLYGAACLALLVSFAVNGMTV